MNTVPPLSLRGRRRRIGFKGELLLALMSTATVLAVLALVEALSNQRLLFVSLASKAFLLYLDPANATNDVRTLVTAQMATARFGLATFLAFGRTTSPAERRWWGRSC